MFDYLRNFNELNYIDYKSILKYNSMNFAAIKNESQSYSEISNDKTIKLPKPSKKIKNYISRVLENIHSV